MTLFSSLNQSTYNFQTTIWHYVRLCRKKWGQFWPQSYTTSKLNQRENFKNQSIQKSAKSVCDHIQMTPSSHLKQRIWKFQTSNHGIMFSSVAKLRFATTTLHNFKQICARISRIIYWRSVHKVSVIKFRWHSLLISSKPYENSKLQYAVALGCRKWRRDVTPTPHNFQVQSFREFQHTIHWRSVQQVHVITFNWKSLNPSISKILTTKPHYVGLCCKTEEER